MTIVLSIDIERKDDFYNSLEIYITKEASMDFETLLIFPRYLLVVSLNIFLHHFQIKAVVLLQ